MTTKQATGQANGGNEKRKYPSQRPLFDKAVRESKFSAAFSELIEGSPDAGQATRIISDLNSCKDRAAYITEIIGIRRAFRDLLHSIEYSEAVAQFLTDTAAMISSLSVPLGNEIIFGLSKAAQNDNYLETVDKAISGLDIDRLENLKDTVRKRKQWQMEAAIIAAKAAEAAERALEPLDRRPAGNAAKKPPEAAAKAEAPKKSRWVLVAAGIAIIGSIAAVAAFSQRKSMEKEPQKPATVEAAYEDMAKIEPQKKEEPEVVPVSAAEEDKAEAPPESEPETRRKPAVKPTRREILLQRLNRLSPENDDDAKEKAEKFAKAIQYSKTDDAVQIVGKLGSIASESPDAGSGNKKKFAISVLRRVAVTGNDRTAAQAIAELGRLVGRESEVVPILEGLGAEEAIQESERRMEALRKALADRHAAEAY